MSETYRTVVTNGKKTNKQNKPGTISKHRKKTCSSIHPHQVWSSFLWYISFWLECGGRSCRGESESQRPAADPGPVEGARSSSIIKVPASVGRAVLLGASYCTKRVSFPCARLLPVRLTALR